MSLEEESNKRKQRLLALRESSQKKRSMPGDGESTKLPSIKQRSYRDDTGDTTVVVSKRDNGPTIEDETKGLVEETLDDARSAAAEIQIADISEIAPKKPNWDLKRELQKKLDRLKPLNESAIANAIRERVKGSGDVTGELAAAVEAHVHSSGEDRA